MICWQIALLPQASMALHVRVMIRVVGHGPPVTLSVNVTTGLASHASVAVAVPVVLGTAEPLQLVSKSAGQVITGGVVSRNVMVCVHVRMFPAQSVAFQVRLIRRTFGQLRVVRLSVKVIAGEGSQLSVALGVPVAAGVVSPHSTVRSGGQVMVGRVLSGEVVTVMVCVQVAAFPAQSVAFQVRRTVIGLQSAARLSVKVIVGFGSQLSVAVAVPVLPAFCQVAQVAVVSTGQVMTGGVWSLPEAPLR
jgi:hypothetical protein